MTNAATTKTAAVFRKTMTVAEQALYTGISGNMHPLYVNAVHAQTVSGGERFVFELAVASLATTALSEIGGPNRRLAGLDLRFPEPVRIGDTVEAQVKVEGERDGMLHTRVICLRQDGMVVAEGSAELVVAGEA
ncbi:MULTISPECIES: MaoC/PaaZ C-terminal domain-containing protein [unclassified Aurantimonas]|uniref:MaoC/PaaZ C-terminal domain-containing protein n=1 Tax=unclassified Aurantimonas TaxID=2638230 RepID=UPI002E17C3C4|nr:MULTISPECIES: MaoC/PaaZ C-terminal domain-containing protein [unclassified Aurantimonas]MEC5293296.1 MaoC/PaaZ C-terminal domain-containing protein [Aurantimonas sp. C2-3-R2]MEC5414390.1 MaoC/PaaZ C-terminal domain-containing protein [Aurantimonas sp. C2-4-R8]